MISQKDLKKILEFVEKAQNPLFFFDNDVDGLASFLLLRRFSGKGKGVAIKSFPELNVSYSRKINELNPDYVFVLDKPIVDKEFLDAALKLNVPVIWIDHHPVPEFSDYENVHYFNPILSEKPSVEPTTYICYEAVKNKEDEWIAMLGCLSDWFVPYFAEEFAEKYGDLFTIYENTGKILYETQIGKIIKILNFALKNRTSEIVKMIKNLVSIKTPYELLEENSKTILIYKRYRQINRKYEKILEKAKEIAKRQDKKLLFFQYGGELSLSSEISNELHYLFPEKIIVVAYVRDAKVNVSARANMNVREIIGKAMDNLEGNFGGHEYACGAKLNSDDLQTFRENLAKLIN